MGGSHIEDTSSFVNIRQCAEVPSRLLVKLSLIHGVNCSEVIRLKVRFIGEGSSLTLITGKIYEVISEENKCYRIIDETDEDYLYHKDSFEIVDK